MTCTYVYVKNKLLACFDFVPPRCHFWMICISEEKPLNRRREVRVTANIREIQLFLFFISKSQEIKIANTHKDIILINVLGARLRAGNKAQSHNLLVKSSNIIQRGALCDGRNQDNHGILKYSWVW